MKFCPKCGAVIIPKGKGFGCSCGYKEKSKVMLISREEGKEKEGMGVLKESESIVMPTIKSECPKCNHKEAYFYTSQTSAGDEAETQFFQCVKCKHRWRRYG